MNNFDMNWITLFTTIYEERSLTKAAIHLNMSEKTLGLILKKLRIYFNNQLFVRGHAGFSPTPLAIELYEQFYQAQMIVRQAINSCHNSDIACINKKLTLSMSPQCEFLFNQIYNRAAHLLTDYSFNLNSAESVAEEVKKLRHGLIDAYVSLEAVEDSFIENEVIASSSLMLCLILSKKHSRYQSIIETSRFDNERFISCTRNTLLENRFFSDMNITPNVLFRRDSIFDLLGVIENNDIILICPSYYQVLLENDDRFHAIKLEDPKIMVKSLYSCYVKNSPRKEEIITINSILKSEIKHMRGLMNSGE